MKIYKLRKSFSFTTTKNKNKTGKDVNDKQAIKEHKAWNRKAKATLNGRKKIILESKTIQGA